MNECNQSKIPPVLSQAPKMTDNDRIEPSCAAVALGCMCAKCEKYADGILHCLSRNGKCPVTYCIEFKKGENLYEIWV